MMADWKKLTVGDLCDTISDTYHRNDDEVVLVNTSDVLEGKILNHQLVENKNLKGQFKKTFKKDDILYSEIRPANKRFAYVDFEDTERYIASTKLMVLRPKMDVVLPRFLFAFLSSNHVLAELQHLAETRSGTFPQITFSSELAPMPIAVPDYETQEKIVGLLSSIEGRIQNNNAINENLTEQARAVFQAWFIDYEPFGGAVPSDWRPSTLGQIAEMKTDSWSPAKNPDVVVEHYSIPAFDEQHYPVFEIASGIKSNKYILNSNSVMISKLNPDTKRIWRPMCLSAHPVCSTEFIVYEAKKQEQRDYIYSILDSVPFLNHLCSHTTGSTNSRQRATPKSTLDFALCLPPDSVIKDFCQIVTPMYDLIASNIVENQSLAKSRDSLLPRLMSGELDVSAIDL